MSSSDAAQRGTANPLQLDLIRVTRIDLHVKVLDERVVHRAKRRGLDALVYAPHFVRLPDIKRRAREFSDPELTVIPAREVFTGRWSQRRHLLAVGLSEPVPDFLTLEATLEEFERQDAAVLVPHPTFASVSLTAAEVRAHFHRFDGIEVYNPKHLPHHNRRARGLAAETGLPAFASSYAHLRGTVGEVWVELDGEIDSSETLHQRLVAGIQARIGRQRGPTHGARRLAEMAHLGWENSWQKLDRTLLSGMEATHPHHPAYNGHFDDRCAY